MKHLAAVGMSVLLAHRSARMPSGGVLSADRAAVPPIVGRWAVLRCVRRQAPRPFVDLMAPVQFAVPPATSRCAARSTGGRPCIAAAIMVGGLRPASRRARSSEPPPSARQPQPRAITIPRLTIAHRAITAHRPLTPHPDKGPALRKPVAGLGGRRSGRRTCRGRLHQSRMRRAGVA